ncbi:hypothetical protein F511_36287 [Dorcoceras hygrometricum]|uniref:Uncharacterized protein n=1 Tax=Dorcoceras hygrometricum TaxID=472368 RepID=A0A2Z7DI54_9LAMI|nr:hypothetical protein F511_36287 [Dorcoceras hygrometricum]
MEDTGMARMIKTLEETGLKGFLAASGSVYENAVVEFFANAKVIAGTVVSFVANRKLALMKEVFAETAPSKKGMEIEYRLLYDIVAKALCAKAGLFDMVTSKKFNLMVAITAGLKFNWAQVLFQVMTAMVNKPTRQSQGFAVQLSVLLDHLVKADLGESIKLHPQKVLTNKSVNTYIKKNLEVGQAGNPQGPSTEGCGEAQEENDKVVRMEKKRKVAVQQPVEARSQAAPAKSISETSLDEDSRLLARLKTVAGTISGEAAAAMDLDRPNGPGSNDEHSVHLQHRDFIITPIADQIGPIDSVSETEYNDLKNHFSEPQCKMTVLPLNSGKPRTCVTLNGSGIQIAVGPQPLWLRNHNSGPAQRIMVKRLATSPHDPLGITDSACKNQLVVVSVRYGPFNPYIPIRSTTIGKSRVAIDPIAMHTSWRSNSDITSVNSVYPPIEIREINWVTYFLQKIDPDAKGKGVLPYLDRPNPVEEHYLLVIQDIRDRAKCQLQVYDQWHKFRTGYRLNKIQSMKLVEEYGEINWVTYFLQKIDPDAKGKGVLPYLDRPNPVEEHYLLVIQDIRDRAKCQLQVYDQWHKFRTGYRLNKIQSMKLVEEYAKTENKLLPWAKTDKDKPSANQDIMAIRMLEAELAQTRKSINLFQARANLPISYNKRSADRVASGEIIPCLTWKNLKLSVCERTDREPEHQNPVPTAEGHIEEVDRFIEDVED